jgi:hypothetical protein
MTNVRAVLAAIAGIGGGMLAIDGAIALRGIEVAYELSQSPEAAEYFSTITSALPLLVAILVEGVFGFAGVVLFIGILKERTWAMHAIPWVAGGLALFGLGVVAAMPNTWHHQIPIIVICLVVITVHRRATKGGLSAT